MNSKTNQKLNLYIINVKFICKWGSLQIKNKKSASGQNRRLYKINLKQISRGQVSSWELLENIFYASSLSSKWSN